MESFFVRYRNLLVLLLLLVVQIIGLAMQVRRTASGRNAYDPADSSGVRLIRLWANAMVSPPERAVESSKTGIGSVWEDYFDLRHVRQENQDLQATIDRLRLEQAALLEDARQGQRLQAMLDFQQKYIFKTLAAQVIGSSGSDQSHVFYINKGNDSDLKRDMAVISSDGIVGKVRDVFPRAAQVLAINDQSSGAGVILETTRIRGILRGNAQGQPQIVGILADNRIQAGEKVLTAGGDQIFPRGLPVGVVQKVERDPDRDGFIHVIVKPAAHLDRLDEVLVITSTEPRFSEQQLKDMATSQQLMAPEAEALDQQRKAAAIMAERLPGLTDPNAPATPATNAQTQAGANGLPQPPAAAVVPKVLPPAHPDRFTPGYAPGPTNQGEPGQGSGQATPRPQKKPVTPKPATPETEKKEAAPDANPPEPKPAQPQEPPTNPQPQRKP
ncbi:MAG TPA: rod shape-determining protein MreC [Terracidiphilus sp.]|nr:rod shape-determining protein MreC [Terracidiphilus sp.]